MTLNRYQDRPGGGFVTLNRYQDRPGGWDVAVAGYVTLHGTQRAPKLTKPGT